MHTAHTFPEVRHQIHHRHGLKQTVRHTRFRGAHPTADEGVQPFLFGKNVGDDLAEGKPTLPLIHAMATGSEEERKLIRNVIRQGGLNDLEKVLSIVHKLGSIEYTRQKAVDCAERACAQLAILPPSPERDALEALTRIAVQRNA